MLESLQSVGTMPFMETIKRQSFNAIPSIYDEIKGKPQGLITLRINTAIAMFALATPDEQEQWMDVVARARRTGESSIMEAIRARVKSARRTTAPTAVQTEGASLKEEIAQAVQRAEDDLKSKRKRRGQSVGHSGAGPKPA